MAQAWEVWHRCGRCGTGVGGVAQVWEVWHSVGGVVQVLMQIILARSPLISRAQVQL